MHLRPSQKYIFLFQENESKHAGSKEDIAARIDTDTKVKIEAMNRSVASNKVKFECVK